MFQQVRVRAVQPNTGSTKGDEGMVRPGTISVNGVSVEKNVWLVAIIEPCILD